MKLLELYEELFQYMCRLNRAAKTSAQPDYARVRGEVKDLLEQVLRQAATDVRLLNQTKRLELPLIFFIDYLICTSRLKFASQWAGNRLAKDRNELAGDERFFDLLEEDLKEPSEDAAERLSVFYMCLCMGFLGMYQGQAEQVRKYIEQIYPRISAWVDRDPRTKISEEAYQFTDSRVLTEPPSNKIILVALGFVFLTLSALAIFYALYAGAVHELKTAVDVIRKPGT